MSNCLNIEIKTVTFLVLSCSLATLGFLSFVFPAHSGSCCINSSGQLKSAARSVAESVTIRRINQRVNKLERTLMMVGSDIYTSQLQQLQQTKRLNDERNLTNYQYYLQNGKAQAEIRAREIFSEASTRFSNDHCGRVEQEQAVSRQAEEEIRERVDRDLTEYNKGESSYGESLTRLADLKENDVNANALFPRDRSLSPEETTHSRNYLRVLTNPLPEAKLSDRALRTGAGRQYKAARNTQNAYLSLSQNTIREVMTDHVATIRLGKWAREQWKKIDSQSVPPGIEGEYISPAGLREVVSSLRVRNPDWKTELMTSTPARLLREIAYIQGHRMEIERLNLETQKRIASLLAVDLARRVSSEMAPVIQKMHSRAIQQINR